MKAIKSILAGLLMVTATGATLAQAAWPAKPIKIIVAYSAGGSGDNLARFIGEIVARDLKQAVVVENKPGASGMLGGAACKSAPPDGYTFCIFLSDVVTINPTIFKNVPYKVDKDFAPVAFVAELAAVLPVSTALPVKSINDLVAYSKATPKGANWGSWGVGSSAHLLLESVNKRFGSSLTHVPYQNTPGLITAVLTSEVGTTIAAYSLVQQHIDGKTMRPIAVLGEKRIKQLPDVPTLVEQGLDFNATLWYGLFAPSATPPEYVKKMNEAVNKAVLDPAAARQFDTMAIYARPMSPADFGNVVRKDAALWSSIARQANVLLD